MKTILFSISLVILSVATAKADTQIVLTQGQCAQVDGQNYCWFYRASNLDHPELAPRPCDFRKDCPLTLLIPTSAASPNLISKGMEQKLNASNVMMFCRETSKDKYSLVRVEVKGNSKSEVVVNEYGDNQEKCEKDEARLTIANNTEEVAQAVGISDEINDVPAAGTSATIIDTTTGRSAPCPQTVQYKTTVKKINVSRIFKRIF